MLMKRCLYYQKNQMKFKTKSTKSAKDEYYILNKVYQLILYIYKIYQEYNMDEFLCIKQNGHKVRKP